MSNDRDELRSSWAKASVSTVTGDCGISTEQAMDNLKLLITSMKGDDEDSKKVPDGLESMFKATFDESLKAKTPPIDDIMSEVSVELSYDEFYQMLVDICEKGYRCELVNLKRCMRGVIEYTVRMTSSGGDEVITVLSNALTKGGKIIFVERKETSVDYPKDSNRKSSVVLEANNDCLARSSWAFASISNQSIEYEEDKVLKEATENIKTLINLQTGEKTVPTGFQDAFEAVFAKQVLASTKPLEKVEADEMVEMNYEQLYEQFIKSFQLGYKAEVVRIKPHLKGVVEYTVYMVNKNSELTTRTTAFIQNGKVTRLERKETDYKEIKETVVEKVSGQVEASDTIFPIEGFKSESQLAAVLLPASGKLVAGSSSGIRPCMQAGSVVKLYMERSKTFMQFKGKLWITDSEGKPYCGGAHFTEYKRRLVTGTAFVLNDKDDKPRAMCFQELLMVDRKAFDIYSTRPLWAGDSPFDEEGGIPCYPWFRLEDDGDHRSIRVWNGAGYKSMWRAYLGKKPKKDDKKHKHPTNKGEIVVRTSSGDADLAYVHKNTDGDRDRYEMTIAPGVDPGLILCVAAVLEVMVGLFG